MVVSLYPAARMSRPNMRPHRPVLRRAALAVVLGLVLPSALAPPAKAQETVKPDQVLARNRRTGAVAPVSGVVTENGLDKVVVTINDKSKDYDSELVVRVVFGNVPPAYRDGTLYFDRGDYENAAAKFRLAAGDASARDVVKASARLRAAEALMRQGAADAAAFGEAATDAATFLADYPLNREVPAARMLQARATHLASNPAGAGELYRTLFREAEGETPTTGYDWHTCLLAGLRAAHCYLEAKDTQSARELFAALDSTLLRVLGGLDPDDAQRGPLTSVQARSRLGEGFALLAAGQGSQAMNFFRGQIASAGQSASPSLRFGAHLGLGEALLAEHKYREAQIEFATVSSIDHTDRDRAARALTGMAECAIKLADANSRTDARAWLQIVIDQYGDTPSVRKGQELLQSL